VPLPPGNRAKAQTDPGTWLNFGLLEAEAFLNAIATGAKHPLVKLYQERATGRGAGKPPLPSNEQQARRLIIIGCVALQDAGLGKHKARKRMAEMLKRTGFPDSPSPSQIEHWERDMLPPLTPWDRHLAARAIVRCGITNLDAIVDYFVGMAHAVLNPNAVAVMDAQ
jgi:hypothetical protein